ncbi:amidohydrolase family protein [Acidobacteriota bacterium]
MRSIKNSITALLAFMIFFSLTFTLSGQAEKNFDILFINGKIIDGAGNPWFYGDVGIKDGRIAAVGDLKNKAGANQVIDIRGKIITPGFIDIHTHSFDKVINEKVWTGKSEKRFFAPNFVSQGVTTLVSNQCGYGPVSLVQQKEALKSRGTGPNTILLIGHNAVRRHVLKDDYERTATDEEIQKMKALVHQAMEDGAFGISSGLEYVPAIWSNTEELVAIVEEIVPYKGIFQAHERASGMSPMWYVPSQDEPGPPNMLENIEELIEVGERTGGTIIATHIKARGKNFWGGSTAIIKLISDARARGVDIWADCYPYNSSGSDGSTVLIPRWVMGRNPSENLQKALLDPEKKEALIKDIRHAVNWRGGTENILVMDFPDKSYIGKSIAELAEQHNISDIDMIIKLQTDGFDRRPGGARLRGFSMSEIDIEAFSAQPWTCTSSDANIALPSDGPVHARYYGTFARKISFYALKRNIMSVEDAVRAQTSLPAQILGLRDRGLLREGFYADLVIFDLDTIKDTATFFEPHQYAQGIEYVMVNGVFTVDKGEFTWKRPGRVLSKDKN